MTLTKTTPPETPNSMGMATLGCVGFFFLFRRTHGRLPSVVPSTHTSLSPLVHTPTHQGVDPSSLLSRASSLLGRLLDALSDAAYAAAPPSVPRSTVDTAVRVGAGLVLLSAAKAAVGLVFTVAAAGLGLVLASRLLSADEGGRGRSRGGRRGRGDDGGDDDFWGR